MTAVLSRRAIRILLVGIQLATFLYVGHLRVANAQRIHEPRDFGDSSEYVRIAKLPLLWWSFWGEAKPPVTSLLYKLVGTEQARIFTFQLYFSILCWGLLALAVASALQSYVLKSAGFALILGFSLSRDIFMWDPFIGSESITFSLTVLFVAAVLWLLADWRAFKAAIVILLAFLTAFSRDTSAWLLPLIAALLVPGLWLSSKRKELLVMIAAFLAIFAASAWSARVGLRQEYNLASIMSFRVFPNPTYLEFFTNQGMPADPMLVEESSYSLTPGHFKWAVFQALLFSPEQEGWREWVRASGTRTYLRFLWFFKADTLQGMFAGETIRDVFYPDLYYYTATGYRPIITSPGLAELLYPTRFGMLYFYVANIIAAAALGYALGRRKMLWLVPIFMVLATYPQAFLVWNGDPNDVARHSVYHNMTERLGLWVLVLLVADTLWLEAGPGLTRLWQGLRVSSLFGRLGFSQPKRAEP
jgi:hypothetical protein